jgi:phage-related minor tail protein
MKLLLLFILLHFARVMASSIPVATVVSAPSQQFVAVDDSKVAAAIAEQKITLLKEQQRVDLDTQKQLFDYRKQLEQEESRLRMQIMEREAELRKRREEDEWAIKNPAAHRARVQQEQEKQRMADEKERLDRETKQRLELERKAHDAELETKMEPIRREQRRDTALLASYVLGGCAIGIYLYGAL